eukprot:4852006-Amphidinium_carterae.1
MPPPSDKTLRGTPVPRSPPHSTQLPLQALWQLQSGAPLEPEAYYDTRQPNPSAKLWPGRDAGTCGLAL